MLTYIQHRDKKTNEKNNSIGHGTILGGALTLVMYALIINYTVAELGKMDDGKYDNFNQQIYTNTLEPELSKINISQTTFMPTLDI